MTKKINCIIWDSANKNFKVLYGNRLFDIIPLAFSSNHNSEKHYTIFIRGIPFFVTLGDTPEDHDMTAYALISGHIISNTSICIYKKHVLSICLKSLFTNYYLRKLKIIMNKLDH